jgi:enterobacteria phage integrase
MARPRLKKNLGLPPNLVFDKKNKQYRYRNLKTGKHHQMGKERGKAISAAKQLNSVLMCGADLVAKVLGKKQTLAQFIDERFLTKYLPKRELADSTLRDYKYKIVHVRDLLGKLPLDEISVMQVNDFLEQYPATQSNRYRSLLVIIFQSAKAAGLTKENPAQATLINKIKKQRQRLSLDGFRLIYEKAGEKGLIWMQNAMDIGLITLQRENDILHMKFNDIITEEINDKERAFLKVIQEKNKNRSDAAYIKIAIGDKLETIITKCRGEINSPYLVHRRPKTIVRSKKRHHFTQILRDYFIEEFSKVRDSIECFSKMPVKQRPTFHEIRSLGITLYEKQGIDAQALAGHTTRRMTETYKKGHEDQWVYTKSA